MLGEVQHPLTRKRVSARIATLLVSCTFTCFMASLVLAGQAPAAGLETVTEAASPVTQAVASVTHTSISPGGSPPTGAVNQVVAPVVETASEAIAPVAQAVAPLTETATNVVTDGLGSIAGPGNGPGGGLISPVTGTL